MKINTKFFLILLLAFPFSIYSQGLIQLPLNKNKFLAHEYESIQTQKLLLLGITDTLTLPFFEDFTQAGLYPNAARWIDNKVYVNNTMCLNPPSFGVATFDHLDEKGNPYSSLDKTGRQDADSLTSQPIKLGDLAIKDSIFISFFYQSMGLGDAPSSDEKLRLEFKNDTNGWEQVWLVSGSAMTTFKQVIIKVGKANFMHDAFQFRFINNTFKTGNLNQWNLDYIRMDKNRNSADLLVDDMTINSNPAPLLKNYRSMPYYQYKANATAEIRDVLNVRVNNLFNIVRQAQFQLDLWDQNNTLLKSYPFTLNSKNVRAHNDTLGFYNKINLSSLPTDRPTVKYTWKIDRFNNQNITPDKYNSQGNNNIISAELKFDNYLAYDDGTAEAGIGLDYSSLPPGDGYFAVEYNLNKEDSLFGVAIFFNQSLENVSSRPFELKVWQKIGVPPAIGLDSDEELVSIDVSAPAYTDSINGFHYFIFDKAVKLNSGKFYVGWKQNGKFILNIGLDQNYGELNDGGINTHIYYSLYNSWLKSRTINGAPMMRPILGKKAWLPVGLTHTIEPANNLSIYPNPASNTIHIQGIKNANYFIFDITGKLILKSKSTSINVSNLKSGLYYLKATVKKEVVVYKFIKE